MATMWNTATRSRPSVGTPTGSSPRPRWFPDLSATVEAQWALKFAGFSPDHPVLVAARTRIDALGDIHRVKTYPKFYLALFGLYDWEGVASLPPPTHAPRRSLR